jgi:chaperonin cofactor prefoldin
MAEAPMVAVAMAVASLAAGPDRFCIVLPLRAHTQVRMEQQQRLAARLQDINNTIKHINALEQEHNEHALVAKTLNNTNPNRNAAMLIGNVLTQLSAQQVLDKVNDNQQRIKLALDKLNQDLVQKEQELAAFKKQHGILIKGQDV